MMSTLTNNETIKECRAAAKAVGLTFKEDTSLTINGAKAYKFTDRKTGETVLSNCTLSSAYNNVCSGYVSTWNGDKFVGI